MLGFKTKLLNRFWNVLQRWGFGPILFSQIDFERILNNLIVDIESNLDLDFVRENNVL